MGFGKETNQPGCTIKKDFPNDQKADYISIVRVFNRLKEDQLHKFMIDIRKSLSKDGKIYLYAIDHDAAVKWANDDGNMASLYGPHWREQDYWIRNWKSEDIIELFRDYGFDWIGTFQDGPCPNIRYPAIKLKFIKSNYNKTPYEYCNINIPEGNIVDIGPGNYPLSQANYYLENKNRLKDPDYKQETLPDQNKIIWGDLEQGIPIPDKTFDFAYCSHVLEHVDNIYNAVASIERIAKKGVIIVPSSYKESLMLWAEDDHIWDISSDGKYLYFTKRDPNKINKLRDNKITSYFTHMYKSENYDTLMDRKLKRWFYDNEKDLDIVFYWEDKLLDYIVVNEC